VGGDVGTERYDGTCEVAPIIAARRWEGGWRLEVAWVKGHGGSLNEDVARAELRERQTFGDLEGASFALNDGVVGCRKVFVD
jgi:hypothetical protein